MEADELTEQVAKQQFRKPTDYLGVSDHKIHAQNVKLRIEGEEIEFTLATFNVLAQRHVWHQSGQRSTGKKVPSWFQLKDAQGLEFQPLSREWHSVRRKTAIYNMISDFLAANKGPVILCLQECDPSLLDYIEKNLEATCVKQSGAKCFNVTLFCDVNTVRTLLPGDVMTVRITPESKKFNLVNFYGAFSTAANEKFFNERSYIFGRVPTFIVGDYSIQCMPLSDQAKNEGSTKTLQEFTASYFEERYGKICDFACHHSGWTSWNYRKNCADREKNVEHFDNILCVHDDPVSVQYTPIKCRIIPKIWWE
jgi:hypothetical protein